MTDMIERVAKAIYESRNGRGCKPWSLLTRAHRGAYLEDARAAIEVMRAATYNEGLGQSKPLPAPPHGR